MDKTIFYSDKLIVTENRDGFILNFVKDRSDVEELVDYDFRIGLSPSSAKKVLYLLFSAVGDYEKKYGEIKVAASIVKLAKEKPVPIGFEASQNR